MENGESVDVELMEEGDAQRRLLESVVFFFLKTREFHLAKRDVGRLKERKLVAETTKARVESDLLSAKKTVRELTLGIEEVNSRTKFQMKRDKSESINGRRYAEIMKELEQVKLELSKLKLDMATVLEEKNRAEKTFEDASLKMKSNTNSIEAIRREIEFVSEEQVLVELARIEATKELAVLESQRKEESARLSAKLEDKKKKISEMAIEIESSKEIEAQLAITTSDVNMLQTQLKLVKEMDKMENFGDQKTETKSVSEELEAAKKELASLKAEGFQFMTSMDVIRDELKHVMEEIARLKKTEDKADLKIQNLNSKLDKAKGKLEAATSAEEKTKSLFSNLTNTLEQMRMENEAAEKDRDLINQETERIKSEIQKSEAQIDMAEERLQTAIQELESVKSSEAKALENLKHMVESSIRSRASTSKQSSEITISNLEYQYLTGQAKGADEIADKKVAAAKAWIEALKASEKEITMKTEIAQRKLQEMKTKEVDETSKSENSLKGMKMVEEELWNWKEQSEKNIESLKRRSSVNMTPARRARMRKVSSPGFRTISRSNSIAAKRKKKGISDLSKFFSGKSGVQE